jgi:hypothetical protein
MSSRTVGTRISVEGVRGSVSRIVSHDHMLYTATSWERHRGRSTQVDLHWSLFHCSACAQSDGSGKDIGCPGTFG